MNKINRKVLEFLAEHSAISNKELTALFQKEVYPSSDSWYRFLRTTTLALGIGFCTLGMLFFFAYNWENIHKFVKIGLIEGLLIGILVVIQYAKLKTDLKNMLLTAAAIIIGVLFAVFGQIYQTGANAYDFFLGWTLAITCWVLLSDYAPLWLLFIVLINTTAYFYSEQVALWSSLETSSVFILGNGLFVCSALYLKRKGNHVPNWLIRILSVGAVFVMTLGIVNGIHAAIDDLLFFVLLSIVTVLYSLALLYGYQEKSTFYPVLITLSFMIISTNFLIRAFEFGNTFLFLSFYNLIVASIATRQLLKLQQTWNA